MGNDGAAFFGSGGASAPTTLVEQAFEGSASRHLPWDSAVTVHKRLLCALSNAKKHILTKIGSGQTGTVEKETFLCLQGNRSALLLSRKIPMLQPGASVTLRFLWGYEPSSQPGLASSSTRDRLIAKYRAKRNLLQENAVAWKASGAQFTTAEPTLQWVGRELAWHNYMLRAGTTFDDFFGEFTVNQATGYLYEDGLNAAARDPLQHVLPLIATHPETARGVLRTTLKQMVKPDAWPQGFQRDLLPYSLMSHGLVWPDRERGPSDLDLWALLTAAEYVLETKDTAFLR